MPTSIEHIHRVSDLQSQLQTSAHVEAIRVLREAATKTRDNLAGLSRSDDDVYAAMVRRLDGALNKTKGVV